MWMAKHKGANRLDLFEYGGRAGFRTWNSFKTGKVLGKPLTWFNIARGDLERLCGSECQYRGGTQEILVDSSPSVMFRSWLKGQGGIFHVEKWEEHMGKLCNKKYPGPLACLCLYLQSPLVLIDGKCLTWRHWMSCHGWGLHWKWGWKERRAWQLNPPPNLSHPSLTW